MSFGAVVSGVPKVVTSSGAVKGVSGTLIGYLVCSTSSGTIIAYDGADASGTMMHNTLTPAAGTFIRCDMGFATGLYLTIGGTISVAVVYA